MKPILETRSLSKLFYKGERAHYLTLRDSLALLPQKLLNAKLTPDKNEFWALKNVSFSIEPGEVVGLIGRNGAGKSTLLKVLSRITPPTKGTARIRGRLGSLLEVGTGFHFELTGRENIYLYGSVLGMKRWEIKRRFDEIVSFAEVEEFLDTPLKHYSSGMYLRLAFAVASHLETDLLLVDEVLAVGDSVFQQKSMSKMGEVAKQGKTIIFVSHNMSTVASTCKRSLLLEKGKLVADGATEDVIKHYLSSSQGGKERFDSPLIVDKITVRDHKGKPAFAVQQGQDLQLDIYYQTQKEIVKPHFIVSIFHQNQPLFTANMLVDNTTPRSINGEGMVTCIFPSVPLLPGVYEIGIRVVGKKKLETFFLTTNFSSFSVVSATKNRSSAKELQAAAALRHSGPVVIPYRWVL